MSYSAEISRTNPTAFMFVIDQSGSMADPVGDTDLSRAEFVCDALNRIVVNLITRSSKSEGVRDYFHIGAIGYGGSTVANALSGSLGNKSFNPISAFEQHPLRVEQRDGMPFPVWFEPYAGGGTPMRKAMRTAAQALAEWCDEYPESFPPTLLHVTDGEPSDGDPEPIVEQLKSLGTEDGEVLILNLHTGQSKSGPIKFPNMEKQVTDGFGKILYRMSSILPPAVAGAARERGYQVDDEARGFFFNVEPIEVVEFFEIGTRASSQAMLLR
jgi:hypothetical protein